MRDLDWIYQHLTWIYMRNKLGPTDSDGVLKIPISKILDEKKIKKAKVTLGDITKLIEVTSNKYQRITWNHQDNNIVIKPPTLKIYPIINSLTVYHGNTTDLVFCSWYLYMDMIRSIGVSQIESRMIRCCKEADVERVFPNAEMIVYIKDVQPKPVIYLDDRSLLINGNIPPYLIGHHIQKIPHLVKLRRYGFILLNDDLTKVLLVKSRRGNWGFPKGKRNYDESPELCATRELKEETGIVSEWFSYLVTDPHQVIEMESLEDPVPSVGLFVAKMLWDYREVVPKPEVLDEIQACEWFLIDSGIESLSSHRRPILEYVKRYII